MVMDGYRYRFRLRVDAFCSTAREETDASIEFESGARSEKI